MQIENIINNNQNFDEIIDQPFRRYRISSKSVFLTYPRATIELEEFVRIFTEKHSSNIKWGIISREPHEPDGHHFHVFAEFKFKLEIGDARNYFSIEGTPGVHVQSCKYPKKCIDYVKKGGNFVKIGEGGPKTTREEIAIELVQSIDQFEQIDYLDIVRKNANLLFGISKLENDIIRLQQEKHKPIQYNLPRGVWIHGDPGIGKSHNVRLWAKAKKYQIFNKSQNKWWDGYRNQEIVLIDDLGPKFVNEFATELKIWLDQYIFQGEVKGRVGGVEPTYKLIIITTNYRLDQFFPDRIDANGEFQPQPDYLAIFRRVERAFLENLSRDDGYERNQRLICSALNKIDRLIEPEEQLEADDVQLQELLQY